MPRLTRRARKDLDRLPSALAAKAYEVTKRLDDEPAPRKNLLGPLKRKRSTRLGTVSSHHLYDYRGRSRGSDNRRKEGRLPLMA